jgi:5-hydroxyisourate hydrolase
MSAITTHILDISRGCPARDVIVLLERQTTTDWELVGAERTNDDGRVDDLLDPKAPLQTGNYRLTFDAETYFAEQLIESFYSQITVTFVVSDTNQHYHVPLLLSPFGYSTYRGS